ncbi:coiled-coil domain-containing protein [Pararhodospirillum oryzae]|uniref:Uncharacterized protein n=1 Tax=Pararhodospirillum oryzae TaxID=478448 RepID=A0A512H810_9PROT|nr:hypothetical protein [Pararhodospirillum oryzae]GEO81595.1 hypothetical protein ROR02_17260 [Pararhodospirillum oryzae]
MSYASATETLRPFAQRRLQDIREQEILRLAASINGANGQKSADSARFFVLKWAQDQAGSKLPEEAWKQQTFEHLAGGRNCSGVRIINDNMDIWTIRSERPDTNVAQRVWTTEITIGFQQSESPLIGVRSLVSSPERELAIEPAVPKFLRKIASKCGLRRQEQDLSEYPWFIGSDADVDILQDMLVDPIRDMPIFVLTVPEGAADKVPLIDPVPLARATLGIASVVVIPARFTWALTERFGKRLSVYGGAARVYLPGFSEDANPYGRHELFLADRISTPESATRISTWMRRLAAHETLKRFHLERDVLSFATVREQSLDFTSNRLERECASDADQLKAARTQISALKDDLNKALDIQKWLYEEHSAAEERAKTAEAQLNAAGFRIQQLKDQLKARGDTPDTNISPPNTWEEFPDWCDQNLVDRVLLSARARREVKAPLYRHVSTAAECLLWLANEYRERRLAGGDGDLRIPLKNGIKNDQCGDHSFKFDWQGKRFDVEWHIKNGGNTRDPTRCLRIYYFWDDVNQHVIIASMPSHITTGAT